MSEISEKCPHCGMNMKKYKHKLNKQMVDVLCKLYYSPGKISELDITHIQINNALKLKYWGLIEPIPHITDGWRITFAGDLFIRGKINMRITAVTYRGIVTGHEGESVTFADLKPESWTTRPEYAAYSEAAVQTGGLFDGI